jgi:hypothetical protein
MVSAIVMLRDLTAVRIEAHLESGIRLIRSHHLIQIKRQDLNEVL